MTNDSWSIDIPGLTSERAAEISKLLLPDSPFGVVVMDPRVFMVRGLDRWTVELIVKCLKGALATPEHLVEDEAIALESMIDDYQDWLTRANQPSELSTIGNSAGVKVANSVLQRSAGTSSGASNDD